MRRGYRIRTGDAWFEGVIPIDTFYVTGRWGPQQGIIVLCLEPARS